MQKVFFEYYSVRTNLSYNFVYSILKNRILNLSTDCNTTNNSNASEHDRISFTTERNNNFHVELVIFKRIEKLECEIISNITVAYSLHIE